MSDCCFSILNLKPSLGYSPEDIEQAWREQSAKFHPDVVDDNDGESLDPALLNQARATLEKPATLLAEWWRCIGGDPKAITRNAPLSQSLMTVFESVGTELGKADGVIKKVESAQTALAKSLLTADTIKSQKSVQTQLALLTEEIEKRRLMFPEIENLTPDCDDQSQLITVLSDLKFLEKWQQQCQQRLLALIAV